MNEWKKFKMVSSNWKNLKIQILLIKYLRENSEWISIKLIFDSKIKNHELWYKFYFRSIMCCHFSRKAFNSQIILNKQLSNYFLFTMNNEHIEYKSKEFFILTWTQVANVITILRVQIAIIHYDFLFFAF